MNRDQALFRAIFIGLAIWLVCESLLAVTLRVEGYDGYWYLSNAWYLAGGPVSVYEPTKAPLLSLLYLPLYWLRALGAPEALAFAGAHLVSVALTLAVGLMLVRTLAVSFSRPLAWAAALAFLGSRIVFRYGAFAMSDLPAALFVLASLEAVRRASSRDGLRARLPFALATAAAILTRYPSALVVPVAMAWDLGGVWLDHRRLAPVGRRLTHHLGGQLLSVLVVAVVHLSVYAVAFGGVAGALSGLVGMLESNLRLGGISARTGEPWWEYVPMLALSSTLPLALLMATGLLVALRRGGRGEALHAAWLAAHLGFVSVVSSHKEARYLIPALPSLFLFALWGLHAAGGWLQARVAALRSAALGRSLAVAFLLAAAAISMTREAAMLAQPFFRRPTPARIAAWTEEQIPPPGRLAWTGNFFPLWPQRFVFYPGDEYYYVFHLAPHVLEYYSGRPILSTRGRPAVTMDGTLFALGLGTVLGEGDGLLSSVPEATVTTHLPGPDRHLTLSPLSAWDLRRLDGKAADEPRFQAAAPISARVQPGSPPVLVVTSFPGITEVMVRQRRSLLSLGLVNPVGGTASLPLAASLSAAEIDAVRLLRYRPRAVPGSAHGASPAD